MTSHGLYLGVPVEDTYCITLFSSSGRQYHTLQALSLHRGINQVQFDAGALPHGIYFVMISSGRGNKTGKVIY